jgi:hypothetical protein
MLDVAQLTHTQDFRSKEKRMVFDPCPHQITKIILKAGAIIRELKGLPEEKNITILYNETAPLFGIEPTQMSSRDADHLPSPAEMRDQDGKFILPKRNCPKCGGIDSMDLFPLCATCTDAEGGKYKSKWECSRCDHKDISEKAFVQWLDELGIDFRPGMKADMGIKTATDNGLK